MDKKTIAIIAVIVIIVAAVGVGLFLTQGKGAKTANTNAVNTTAANTTAANTTVQNTTSNAPSPNDYYIDEDGEREYYYDDYYDNDGPYD